MSAPPITSTWWKGRLRAGLGSPRPPQSLDGSLWTYLFLQAQPLGVGGFSEALHTHGCELHHALGQGHQVQDATKSLHTGRKVCLVTWPGRSLFCLCSHVHVCGGHRAQQPEVLVLQHCHLGVFGNRVSYWLGAAFRWWVINAHHHTWLLKEGFEGGTQA